MKMDDLGKLLPGNQAVDDDGRQKAGQLDGALSPVARPDVLLGYQFSSDGCQGQQQADDLVFPIPHFSSPREALYPAI